MQAIVVTELLWAALTHDEVRAGCLSCSKLAR